MSNFVPVLFILCIGLLTTKTRALYSLFLVLIDLRRHGVRFEKTNRFEKTWSLWDSFCLALDSFFIGACSLRHCCSIKMPESKVSHGLLGLIGRLCKASWTSVNL